MWVVIQSLGTVTTNLPNASFLILIDGCESLAGKNESAERQFALLTQIRHIMDIYTVLWIKNFYIFSVCVIK